MTKEILQILKKKAIQSSCYFYVAVMGFDKNFNYVGSATNKPRFHRENGGIHAEINLLKKYGPRIKHILLCRVGKSGKFRPIHPCENCRKVLEKNNVKVITVESED